MQDLLWHELKYKRIRKRKISKMQVDIRTCQIWREPGFVRLDAVIALRWGRAESELVIGVTGEDCNSWSR